jgi:ABC-type sugar transport system ATPase subunit
VVTEPLPIVEVRGASITFPGVKALDDVNFRLLPGEVHTLMGENGAGKSTLIKALTGVYQIDSGSILVFGEERRFSGTASAQAAGISTVYQEVNLCTNLTIGENVMLGHESRSSSASTGARPTPAPTRCSPRWVSATSTRAPAAVDLDRCSSSSRSAGPWSPSRRS